MDSIFLTPSWHFSWLFLPHRCLPLWHSHLECFIFYVFDTNQVYVFPATASVVNYVVMQLRTAGLSRDVLGLCDTVLIWFMAPAWIFLLSIFLTGHRLIVLNVLFFDHSVFSCEEFSSHLSTWAHCWNDNKRVWTQTRVLYHYKGYWNVALLPWSYWVNMIYSYSYWSWHFVKIHNKDCPMIEINDPYRMNTII
jgi:hypothetical protein